MRFKNLVTGVKVFMIEMPTRCIVFLLFSKEKEPPGIGPIRSIREVRWQVCSKSSLTKQSLSFSKLIKYTRNKLLSRINQMKPLLCLIAYV